ncbi:MAG: hypothetical protein QM754_00750 [Tepidisphaeraceae bacterium]
MPRYNKEHVPAYRLHKRSGNAVVTIGGKDHYLGRHDKSSSKEAYRRLIAEWLRVGRPASLPAMPAAPDAGPSVDQIVLRFLQHAQTYYRDSDGNPTGEYVAFTGPIKTLRKLYGSAPAASFSPRCLKACQADMVAAGLARKNINRRIGRIRQIFRFAVGEELIPPAVLDGLKAVNGLKRGRTDAKETAPIKPVSESVVMAAIAHASPCVAAMIELQMLTGMRSGELVTIRTADIDRTGYTWTYRPRKHKTQHHGHSREVHLGGRCQQIIEPFLKMDGEAFVFSPAEDQAARLEARRRARKTPQSCGNRPGTNRKARPDRKPGEKFTVGSYATAVKLACQKAFLPPLPLGPQENELLARWRKRLTPEQKAELAAWDKANRFHPHQLRHTAGTRFRRDHGLDAARALLGQKTVEAAEIYAEIDTAKAREVMRLHG